jgi:hypothetical protein
MEMERRRDELAAADHARLVKLALKTQNQVQKPQNVRPWVPAGAILCLLGQGLYRLGMKIQGSYKSV